MQTIAACVLSCLRLRRADSNTTLSECLSVQSEVMPQRGLLASAAGDGWPRERHPPTPQRLLPPRARLLRPRNSSS